MSVRRRPLEIQVRLSRFFDNLFWRDLSRVVAQTIQRAKLVNLLSEGEGEPRTRISAGGLMLGDDEIHLPSRHHSDVNVIVKSTLIL